jgi:integrase
MNPLSRKSGNFQSADVRPLSPAVADLLASLDQFSRRYWNHKTAEDYRNTLTRLFRHTGRRHPAELTEADLIGFCTTGNPANNTVYQRRTKIATFLRWCHRSGLVADNAAEHLGCNDSPLRTFKRPYGKVQAKNPGRWLSHDVAYGRLIPACQDGTIVGLRDEIVIRLGLLGMRISEIRGLTVDSLRHLPTVTWTGKGHKPRQATAGRACCVAITRYIAAYPHPRPDSPLICRQVCGSIRHGGPGRLDWHRSACNRTVFDLINTRAKAVGLGHVAPHDLHRTAAGILHNATTDDGAHHFDLLDIQRVLGHSDPATTMRSYLEPMNTGVLDRAAAFLD